MADNVLYLHHIQYRRLEERLIQLRNHATTLHGCEKAVYYIDKALDDVKGHIASHAEMFDVAMRADGELLPPHK